MGRPGAAPTGLRPLTDEELQGALRERLPRAGPVRVGDRRIFKRRRDWRGERLFERVDVAWRGAPGLELCLKYFAPGPGDGRPGERAAREAAAYRFLDEHSGAGAPACFGVVEGPGSRGRVLLLEYVRGRRLKKTTDPATWLETARWLGRLHSELARATRRGARSDALPRRTEGYFRGWARRAVALAAARAPGARPRLQALLDGYGPVASALAAGPATLVHGEFYCTNVMVREEPGTERFCPFDWETAGVGCGTLDVAYLGRQKLGLAREDLLAAYADGWTAGAGSRPDVRSLRLQHAAARVHERVYMLWSACAHREASPAKVEKYLGKLDDLTEGLEEARSTGAGR